MERLETAKVTARQGRMNPPATKVPAENVAFSYAADVDDRVKRIVIRAVELMTGQPRLKRMYDVNQKYPRPGESFWMAAVRLLRLKVLYETNRLKAIPKDGPVVIVANHPYGVLDGIVICYLISLVRSDFKVLTNNVLYQAPEAKPYILPVDFAETKDALQTNLRTRQEALRHLNMGGAVIVFPAGGISTARKAFGRAIDDEWKPFTAKMIQSSRASVVPVFFEGQNSRLFQWASRMSQTLRVSLVFKEVCRRIGDTIGVRIGEVIEPEVIASVRDRTELMAMLREKTYALAPPRKRPIEKLRALRKRRRVTEAA